MKLKVRAGTADHSAYVFLQDDTATDGSGITGVAFGAVTAYQVRPRAAAASITVSALANATAAYSAGGWVEVDATNMPGLYRFDIPAAVLAAGVGAAVVMIRATGAAPVLLEYQLDDTSEPTSVPAADASLDEKVNWLYLIARGRLVQTTTLQTVRNDADTADVATSVISKDATTTTRDKYT